MASRTYANLHRVFDVYTDIGSVDMAPTPLLTEQSRHIHTFSVVSLRPGVSIGKLYGQVIGRVELLVEQSADQIMLRAW